MFIKLCAARLALALPVTGFETMSISAQGMPKSVVRRVHGSDAKFDDTYSVNGVAVDAFAGTIENIVQASGRQAKVALLFRGESFRGIHKTSLTKRTTCGKDSLYWQRILSHTHNRLAAKIAKLGIEVDIFGVTYACTNHLDYAINLPEMYVPKVKAFDIIPSNTSTQQSTMTHVLRMALSSGTKYDGIYLLRWDYDYSDPLTRMSRASCFLDASPRQLSQFDSPNNPDGLLYIPGPYADQMLAYIAQGSWEDGEKNHKPCCEACGRACNSCVHRFLNYLGEKLAEPPRLCTCPECRDRGELDFALKDWTPEADAHAVDLNQEVGACR